MESQPSLRRGRGLDTSGATTASKLDRSLPLPWTVPAVIVVCGLDSINVLPPSLWGYLTTAVILLVTLIIDGGLARLSWQMRHIAVVVGAVFGAWMLLLAIRAIVSATWHVNTLIIIFGACILLAAPVLLRLAPAAVPRVEGRPWSDNARSLAAAIFAAIGIVNGLSTLGIDSPTVGLNHESMFVAVWCLCLPIRRGAKSIKFAICVAIVISLIRYPAATSILALAAAILIAVALRSQRRMAGLLLVAASGLIAIYILPRLEEGLAAFYGSVGRTDNSGTREFLWSQAQSIIALDPLAGGAASASIAGLANIRGIIQPVPFHNTLLTLGVVGGFVAIGLFILLLVVTLGYATFSAGAERTYVRTWAPALLAAAVCLSVNPVLESLGTAAAFYVLILCASMRPSDSSA